MNRETLIEACRHTLAKLESDGHIVIVTPDLFPPLDAMADAVLNTVPQVQLTTSDLAAIRALLVHLAYGPSAYCQEDLPACTGMSLAQFAELIEKLPLE